MIEQALICRAQDILRRAESLRIIVAMASARRTAPPNPYRHPDASQDDEGCIKFSYFSNIR
jgi:hypothetical protein